MKKINEIRKEEFIILYNQGYNDSYNNGQGCVATGSNPFIPT